MVAMSQEGVSANSVENSALCMLEVFNEKIYCRMAEELKLALCSNILFGESLQ
jgi:hypothetical protein